LGEAMAAESIFFSVYVLAMSATSPSAMKSQTSKQNDEQRELVTAKLAPSRWFFSNANI